MNIKPMNISEEEKTRIFEESLKNQTPYVEKEPVKIQPVKRGRWELTDNPSFRKCSECGAWWGKEFTTNNYVNYCPRCGADMRELNE